MKMNRRVLVLLLISFCALGLIVYGTQAEGKKAGDNTIKGIVQDASGQAAENAAVYLIPSSDVEAMAEIKGILKTTSPSKTILLQTKTNTKRLLQTKRVVSRFTMSLTANTSFMSSLRTKNIYPAVTNQIRRCQQPNLKVKP